MRRGRPGPFLLAALLLLLAACGALEPGSVPVAEIPDPLTLERTGKPNDWLVCPVDACRAEPSETSRDYAVGAQALWAAWLAVLAEAPRAVTIARDDERMLLLVQDRTPVFRFVDTIAVHVVPMGERGATFAAYSHSEIGYGDLGTNRRRLQGWVQALERKLPPG